MATLLRFEVSRSEGEQLYTDVCWLAELFALECAGVTVAKLHIRICGRALLKYLPVCLPLECTQTVARIHIVDTRSPSYAGFPRPYHRALISFLSRNVPLVLFYLGSIYFLNARTAEPLN